MARGGGSVTWSYMACDCSRKTGLAGTGWAWFRNVNVALPCHCVLSRLKALPRAQRVASPPLAAISKPRASSSSHFCSAGLTYEVYRG